MQPRITKEELEIYIRDFLFFIFTALVSVASAEIFLIRKGSYLVDRVFAYLIIFIPLIILNFIAHFYYRNRRIRLTGTLKSSFRYQLSLAFMLVSVIPSIPIFLLSSNMMEKIISGIFRVDVIESMDAANGIIQYYIKEEEMRFAERTSKPILSNPGLPYLSRPILESYFRSGLLSEKNEYAALYRNGRVLFEKGVVYLNGKQPQFHRFEDNKEKNIITVDGKVLLMYRFSDAVSGTDLIIGHRLYEGQEEHVNRFLKTYESLQNEKLWNIEIPNNILLFLGAIYIFMILVALFFSIYIARQISLPIVSLAHATRSVTEGNLNTKIQLKSAGEMGVLIESFNHMIDELHDLRKNLLHTQRVAAWQEVARRLAHEIKNPLTPIQLSAQRMLRKADQNNDEDFRGAVKTGAATIIEQVNVLQNLLEEFSDFARMPKARPAPESLEAIITESVNLFQGIKGVTVETVLSGNLPLIQLDRNLILGMVNNLLKNAVEAVIEKNEKSGMIDGMVSGKIRISTSVLREGVRKYAVLSVEDSGTGIDEKLQDRIFEPYFSTKGEHGSGLGLAIVEKALHDHDAKITVRRSRDLGGAEFRILFRVKDIVT